MKPGAAKERCKKAYMEESRRQNKYKSVTKEK
jgi:hypothetical protein